MGDSFRNRASDANFLNGLLKVKLTFFFKKNPDSFSNGSAVDLFGTIVVKIERNHNIVSKATCPLKHFSPRLTFSKYFYFFNSICFSMGVPQFLKCQKRV